MGSQVTFFPKLHMESNQRVKMKEKVALREIQRSEIKNQIS